MNLTMIILGVIWIAALVCSGFWLLFAKKAESAGDLELWKTSKLFMTFARSFALFGAGMLFRLLVVG